MNPIAESLKEFVRLIRLHETSIANGDEPDPASNLSQNVIASLEAVETATGVSLTDEERIAVLEG